MNLKKLVVTSFLASGLSFAAIATAQEHATESAEPAEAPSAERHVDTTGGHEATPREGAGQEVKPHVGAAHEGGEHAGGHHGPEAMNWTDLSDKHRPAYIGLLINFGILVALYYTLGKKPIAAGLKQRRVNIGKDIEEASKMLEEAKERAKKYQADLKNADTDAATAKAALVTAGKGEVERLISEAEERGERMKRDAERLVDQEKKQLQQDLLIETVNLAVAQAQTLLEKSATPEDHTRLANELLAELSRKAAQPRSIAPRAGASS